MRGSLYEMKKKEDPKPYKADYQGATAKEVAQAVLRHRPTAKQDASKIFISIPDQRPKK